MFSRHPVVGRMLRLGVQVTILSGRWLLHYCCLVFETPTQKWVWSQGTFPALFRHGSSKTQKCCKNAIKCLKVVLSLYVSGHQHHRKSCWAQKLLYCRLNDEVAVRKCLLNRRKESLKQLQLSFQAMTKNWPLQKVPCAKGPISSKTNHEIRLKSCRPLSNAVVLSGSAFLSGLGRPLNQRNARSFTKPGMMSVMTWSHFCALKPSRNDGLLWWQGRTWYSDGDPRNCRWIPISCSLFRDSRGSLLRRHIAWMASC